MPVVNCMMTKKGTLTIPDLEWLASNTVQNGKESGLVGVLEHVAYWLAE